MRRAVQLLLRTTMQSRRSSSSRASKGMAAARTRRMQRRGGGRWPSGGSSSASRAACRRACSRWLQWRLHLTLTDCLRWCAAPYLTVTKLELPSTVLQTATLKHSTRESGETLESTEEALKQKQR